MTTFPVLQALELGRAAQEVDRALDLLARAVFADKARDYAFLFMACSLAEAAARIPDESLARRVMPLVAPYAQRGVALGGTSFVGYCGCAALRVGMLHATLGDWDAAERQYRFAISFDERMRAVPAMARARLWYARALLSRGADGDHRQAADMATSARVSADRLGMARLAAQARDLLDSQAWDGRA
jgi:hypothetical protein